jgi:hypothetical protein
MRDSYEYERKELRMRMSVGKFWVDGRTSYKYKIILFIIIQVGLGVWLKL